MGAEIKCKICGKIGNGTHSRRKYCNECYDTILKENFLNLYDKIGVKLLYKKNFNDYSQYKFRQYVKFYGYYIDNISTWVDVLEYFGFKELFINDITDKYKKFLDTNPLKKNINEFKNIFKEIQHNDIMKIGWENILKEVGMNYSRYNHDEYFNNIILMKNELGKIPSYNEFLNKTKISINAYCSRFKEVSGYEDIIRLVFGEDGVDEYLKERFSIRSKRCYDSQINNYKYTDDEMINKFRDSVKTYMKVFGVVPSSKILSKRYNIDLKHFKLRLGMGYVELLRYIGVKDEDISFINKSELSCLNHISKILNCEYEPQKQFYWLKSDKDYPLFCDGYFEEYNLVVEFQGRQHYKYVEGKFGDYDSFLNQINNDNIKRKIIPENGIILLEIMSSSPWYKEDWMIKKLKSVGIKVGDNIV